MGNKVICPGCGRESGGGVPINKYENVWWHTVCYENRYNRYVPISVSIEKKYSDEEWKTLIFQLLHTIVQIPDVDYEKVRSQIRYYGTIGYKPKYIYYALVYYYIIENGDPSLARGGIGIVPWVMDKSNAYWKQRGEQYVNNQAAAIKMTAPVNLVKAKNKEQTIKDKDEEIRRLLASGEF